MIFIVQLKDLYSAGTFNFYWSMDGQIFYTSKNDSCEKFCTSLSMQMIFKSKCELGLLFNTYFDRSSKKNFA